MFGVAAYFTLVRRHITEEQTGAEREGETVNVRPSVNILRDIEVLKELTARMPDANCEEFRNIFGEVIGLPKNMLNILPSIDDRSEVKGLLILLAVSLMNVEDITGAEKDELIEFFHYLTVDPEFTDLSNKKTCYAFQALALLLFGTCDVKVSTVFYTLMTNESL